MKISLAILSLLLWQLCCPVLAIDIILGPSNDQETTSSGPASSGPASSSPTVHPQISTQESGGPISTIQTSSHSTENSRSSESIPVNKTDPSPTDSPPITQERTTDSLATDSASAPQERTTDPAQTDSAAILPEGTADPFPTEFPSTSQEPTTGALLTESSSTPPERTTDPIQTDSDSILPERTADPFPTDLPSFSQEPTTIAFLTDSASTTPERTTDYFPTDSASTTPERTTDPFPTDSASTPPERTTDSFQTDFPSASQEPTTDAFLTDSASTPPERTTDPIQTDSDSILPERTTDPIQTDSASTPPERTTDPFPTDSSLTTVTDSRPSTTEETLLVCDFCNNAGDCRYRNQTVNCDCHYGYSGERCQIYDVCLVESPCQENFTCLSLPNSNYRCRNATHAFETYCPFCNFNGNCSVDKVLNFTLCHCEAGYSGDQCQEFDYCFNQPCGGNSTCQDINGGNFRCINDTHIFESNCDFCNNRGECITDTTNITVCRCRNPYTGERCQIYNVCLVESPCQENFTCLSLPNSNYRCRNATHAFETYCPFCNFNGNCSIDKVLNFTLCHCEAGYSGDQCQEFDYCFNQPCGGNSTCQDINGGNFRCINDTHIFENNCDFCNNRGECITDTTNITVCRCRNPYTGERCQIYNVCLVESPCQENFTCLSLPNSNYRCRNATHAFETYCPFCNFNGNCSIDKVLNFTLCHCEAGYSGDQCQEFDYCFNQPCGGNSTCQDINGGNFRCINDTHIFESNCDFCNNRGECITDTTNITVCRCRNPYTGDRCEDYNKCLEERSPCPLGGRCFRIDNDNHGCDNATHLYQSRCLFCNNNGQCTTDKRTNLTECSCDPLYTGNRCENSVDICQSSQNPCPTSTRCLSKGAEEFACQNDTHIYESTCPQCNVHGSCVTDLSTNETTCDCYPPYIGARCEIQDLCLTQGQECNEHNATCSRIDDNHYKCENDTHIYLSSCQDCNYKGSCIQNKSSVDIHCDCFVPFTGNQCENRDLCLRSKCGSNDVCVRVDDNHYNCDNATHLFESTCATCNYRGSCLTDKSFNRTTCTCNRYYTDANCTYRDLCLKEDRCSQGSNCSRINNGNYECRNSTHLFETRCSYCQNGADCTTLLDTYNTTCYCPVPFRGERCDIRDPCLFDPCETGSNCTKLSDEDFTCKNGTHIYEPYCSFCYGNGNCTSDLYTGEKVCTCEIPWTGSQCNLTDPCSSNPCNSLSTCYVVDHDRHVCISSTKRLEIDCEECHYDGHCVINNRDNVTEYCLCREHYFGAQCQYYNSCAINPCPPTQRCETINHDGYRCFNDSFEFLTTCEYCNFRGNCTTMNGVTTCGCSEIGAGRRCEAYFPCSSSDSCEDYPTARCEEITGTDGYRCTNDSHVLEEVSLMCSECSNRGSCVTVLDEYYPFCDCFYPYTGPYCTSYLVCPKGCDAGEICVQVTYKDQICLSDGQTITDCPWACSSECRFSAAAMTFFCACPPGFLREQGECVDINECEGYLNTCSHSCVNTNGSFYCDCTPGFQLKPDNVTCTDINECNGTNSVCSQICVNFHGSYRCECEPGFELSYDNATCEDINECSNFSLNNCSQSCVNTNGSFRCDCFPGFQLEPDNVTCTDMNECNGTVTVCSQICVNFNGSYRCECEPGYELSVDNRSCEDINECNNFTLNNCSQECMNTNGSYLCDCHQGFQLLSDGFSCEDLNECDNASLHNCSQRCLNENGTYKCSCYDGFTLLADNVTCEDINECSNASLNNCSQECLNTYGGFLCNCSRGYELSPDGFSCLDINECQDALLNNCSQECMNTNGSYVCDCHPGFQLLSDGLSCEDLNECENTSLHNCSQRCLNENGTYKCSCYDGFTLLADNVTCEDINECSNASLNNCSQECLNTYGDFHCNCSRGYELASDEFSCLDINECQDVLLNNCSQECMNTNGSYVCDCYPGFQLMSDEFYCEDVNECDNSSLHNCSQRCFNENGTYRCACYEGFFLLSDNVTCEDINECSDFSQNNCSQECVNTNGGYFCNCSRGYELSSDGFSCLDIDECQDILQNNCSQLCVNTNGSHRCECIVGYSLSSDGVSCEDVDECSQPGLNNCSQVCLNTNGSYYCDCHRGYALSVDNVTCEDENECLNESLNNCSQDCMNTDGSYNCSCYDGYYILSDGITCSDIDECSNVTLNQCSQECTNTNGSYFCGCQDGFDLAADNSSCEDINECLSASLNNCSQECVNTNGSHYCECSSGFSLAADRVTCEDIDECLGTSLNNCSQICLNTEGDYKCECYPGYSLTSDGQTCVDINECRVDPSHNCSQLCVNEEGNYSCDCYPGFQLMPDGFSCEDLNECADSTLQNCSQSCLNENGTYTCVCHDGYTILQDNVTCIDINECNNNSTNLCEQVCVNTDGDFRCECVGGYRLSPDGYSCSDINECLDSQLNNCSQICVNNDGSYTCSCDSGYALDADGFTCLDINECDNGTLNTCSQICTNTNGSFYCQCREGFKLSGDTVTCDDIDECSSNQGNNCSQICVNNNGSYTCSCDNGFELDADEFTCLDINECDNGTLNTCSQICTNTNGSFDCECRDGFYLLLDSVTCDDIDECSSDQGNNCSQICVNNNGSYTCSCDSGYVLDADGFLCLDVNECDNGTLNTCSQICTNTNGSFDCKCGDGFSLSLDSVTCDDIDECSSNQGNNCSQICVNNNGSYTCSCDSGYELDADGFSCLDINECDNATLNTCSQICTNTNGSFDCECGGGYTLSSDAVTCDDIDECSSDQSNTCSQICLNTFGSYSCDCWSGFALQGDNSTCGDIDECLDMLANDCSQICENVNGSFFCLCEQGYTLLQDNATCQDRDECLDPAQNSCSQECVNTQGSFHCDCLSGFSLLPDNVTCDDIDECSDPVSNICSQRCVNTGGTFYCDCLPGFTFAPDNSTCEDIDECLSSESNFCSQICVNNVGSFECGCSEGYSIASDNFTCDDFDECSDSFQNTCSQICLNKVGTFACGCFPGFSLSSDNVTCEDVNECLNFSVNICTHECINTDGSFICDCDIGYSISSDNFTCEDVNECVDNERNNCSQNCVNTAGSHYCECFDGYSLADNITCEDINECLDPAGYCNGSCVNMDGSFYCECPLGYKEVNRYCYVEALTDLVFSVKLTGYTYSPELNDPNSTQYKSLSREILSNVDTEFSYLGGYRRASIISYRQGSVIVDFSITAAQASNLSVIVQSIEAAVQAGTIGSVSVDPTYFIGQQGSAFLGSISMSKSTQDLIVGESGNITCTVEAILFNTSLTMTWTVNNSRIAPRSTSRLQVVKAMKVSSSQYNGSLTYRDIKATDSNSVVECTASAGDVTKRTSTTVIVHRVVLTTQNLIVKEGDSTSLQCQIQPATFTGNLGITWCKNGAELESPSPGRVVNVSASVQRLVTGPLVQATEYGCGLYRPGSSKRICTVKQRIITYKPEIKKCPSYYETRINYTWPELFLGQTEYKPCPAGYTGLVSRTCREKGAVSLYTNCAKEQLQTISDQVDSILEGIQTVNLTTVLSNFSVSTEDIAEDQNLAVGNLNKSIEILTKVKDIAVEETVSKTETEDFVKAVDNILSTQTKTAWDKLYNETSENSAAKVMTTVNEFATRTSVSKTLKKGQKEIIQKDNIVMEFKKSPIEDIEFPQINQATYNGRVRLSSATISKAVGGDDSVDYAATYFKTLSELFPVVQVSTGKTGTDGQRIGSDIIAFSLIDVTADNLDPPLQLYFENLTKNESEEVLCSFWNTSVGNGGAWSSEGCWLDFSNETAARCLCNHLTNFAILMSPSVAPEGDAKVLRWISIIGCSLSIAGLTITFILHVALWRHVRNDKAVVLVNLCAALLVALIVFLSGVEQTGNKELCTAIAVLLQYFFLAALFLMLAEGLIVAISVVYVFTTRSKIRILLPIAWGSPLVIVGISMGATQLQGFGNNQYCWLSIEDGVIYAFVVPALLIIVTNIVITVIVLRALYSTKAIMSKTRGEKLKAGARSIAVLAPLLGLTWIFGVLSVNSQLVVFQYLFTIFNSLQGLFIFIFHCLISKSIRDVLRRKCPCLAKPYLSYSKSGSSASNKFSNSAQTTKRITNGTQVTESDPSKSSKKDAGNSNHAYIDDDKYKDDKINDGNDEGATSPKSVVDRNNLNKLSDNQKNSMKSKDINISLNEELEEENRGRTNSESERTGGEGRRSSTKSSNSSGRDLLYVQWTDGEKRSVTFNPSPFNSMRSLKPSYYSPFEK